MTKSGEGVGGSMADNLPVVHPGVPDDDPLVADSTREAVIVSQWRNSQAIVMGDESKEEWIVAPAAYGLDWME